jgi:hypothetical protein
MGHARKLRGDRIAAWTVVCIAHAALGWLLMRPPMPPRSEAAADSALDLVWVAAARTADHPRVQARRAVPAASGRPAVNSVRPASHGAPAMPTHAEAAPSASQSMSAVFIRQAGEMAARQAPGSFQPDPFADRAVRLPGRAANTFRMRPPPSLAQRLAKVGKLFGGADYETDPCRSVSKSINDLSQDGDSRVLQDALDYERRYCR